MSNGTPDILSAVFFLCLAYLRTKCSPRLLLRTKVYSLSGNLAGRKRSVPYFCWFELLSASSGHIRFHPTPNCSAACYITRFSRGYSGWELAFGASWNSPTTCRRSVLIGIDS
jgi:hypothetical protein